MTLALASNALTTVAALLADMGITDTSDKPATAINIVSDFIAHYCGRTFGRATVTSEKHAGTGTRILMVDVRPIVTLTSIAYLGTAIDTAGYEIHDADAGMIMRLYDTWGADYDSPIDARKEWAVTYVGGYVLPKDESATPPAVVRTLPWDLENAAKRLAASVYQGMARDGNIISESLNGYSVQYRSYVDPLTTLEPIVRLTLDKYRGA